MAYILRIIFTVVMLADLSYARAGSDKIAVLMPGTAATHVRKLVTAAVEAVAQDTGFSPVRSAFAVKDSTILKCVTTTRAWSCIAPMVHDKELQHIAVVSLANDTASDGSPMTVVTEQIIVADLDTAIAGQRFCARCTDDVLVNATTELTRALLQEIQVRSGRTVVAIKSTPRGARIMFDGNSIGATDRSFNTFPGKHTIVLEFAGYRQEARTVEAALDKTSEIAITLRSLTMSPDEHHDGDRCEHTPGVPFSTSLAPKLAIGAGAMAVIAGVVVLAFNEHPKAVNMNMEQPRVYYDTRAPGVGLIVGGFAVGIGGYFWWRYARTSLAPTIALTSNSRIAGIIQIF